MDYMRETNAFYDRLEVNPLATSAIVLWHALMAVANKARWPQTFTVAVSVLQGRTGLSADAIFHARNLLMAQGLISWEARGGKQCAAYTLRSCVEPPDAPPTQEPTQEPMHAPTQEPTQEPMQAPTQAPTQEPTQAPTQEPMQEPTQRPTQSPPLSSYPTDTQKTKTYTKTKTKSPPLPPMGEGEIAPLLDACGFSAELCACLREWLRYKAEKRQAYKPTGLRALLGEVRARVDAMGEAQGMACMRASMANGWQGIAWNLPRVQEAPRIGDMPRTGDMPRMRDASPGAPVAARPVRETAQHRYSQQRRYTEAELNALVLGEQGDGGG